MAGDLRLRCLQRVDQLANAQLLDSGEQGHAAQADRIGQGSHDGERCFHGLHMRWIKYALKRIFMPMSTAFLPCPRSAGPPIRDGAPRPGGLERRSRSWPGPQPGDRSSGWTAPSHVQAPRGRCPRPGRGGCHGQPARRTASPPRHTAVRRARRIYGHSHDGSVIHCFDGRNLVLALVTPTAQAECFSWPKPSRDTGRPSIRECNLVVDRCLSEFAAIIKKKFTSGERGVLPRTGALPVVMVTLAGIQRSGVTRPH